MTPHEKDELLLTQVVLMFQTAALQQLGKLKNPITDRAERDLEQARISIDILDVLHRKMKSNLTDGEERLLTNVLRDLQLNFVDELSRPDPPQKTGDTPAEPPPKPDGAAADPPPQTEKEKGA